MAEIRELREKDLTRVYKLMHKILPQIKYYPRKVLVEFLKDYSMKNLKHIYSQKGACFLGAFEDKRLVGFSFGWNDHGVFWIDWTCVEEHHRRGHIALQLGMRMEKEAKKLGCHKMHADTSVKNIPTLLLAKKKGWFIEATLKNHWFKWDYVLLSKNLKNPAKF